MWICPKCGRSFETENQDHECDEKPATIDTYIAVQPQKIQPILNQVRNKIRAVLPDAQERISWRMPTFWKEHNIIHFDAHKKHLGLYPGPAAIEHFDDALKKYKRTKGAIQFPYDQPIPLDLIVKITKWCYVTGHHH